MPCSVKINRRRRIYAAPFATLLRCRLCSLAFDAQRLGHVGDGAVYVPLGRCAGLHRGVLNLWLNEQVDEYGTLCGQGFVNASVLDQYDRSFAAYPESGDDGHDLAFAADRDQIQCWLIGQKLVHEVGFAIWKPDNVAELFFFNSATTEAGWRMTFCVVIGAPYQRNLGGDCQSVPKTGLGRFSSHRTRTPHYKRLREIASN
jgi:hypothetical protein